MATKMDPKQELVIISAGRGEVAKYTQDEYRTALTKAFVTDGGADYIVLDSNWRGQRFLWACAAWAFDAGLIYCDQAVDEGQTFIYTFRLTDAGRTEFGR